MNDALNGRTALIIGTNGGTLIAMQHELAALPDGGSIVNVVSTAGLAGAPGMVSTSRPSTASWA